MTTFIKYALIVLAWLVPGLCAMSVARRVARFLRLEWFGRRIGADFGLRPTFHLEEARLDDIVTWTWFKWLLFFFVVNHITRWTLESNATCRKFGRNMWEYVTVPWLWAPFLGFLLWKAGLPLFGAFLDLCHAPSWRVITSWLDQSFGAYLNGQWLSFWSWMDTP